MNDGPSNSMEGVWFMTYTAPSHQGASKMLCVYFREAVIPSMFMSIYRHWVRGVPDDATCPLQTPLVVYSLKGGNYGN